MSNKTLIKYIKVDEEKEKCMILMCSFINDNPGFLIDNDLIVIPKNKWINKYNSNHFNKINNNLDASFFNNIFINLFESIKHKMTTKDDKIFRYRGSEEYLNKKLTKCFNKLEVL